MIILPSIFILPSKQTKKQSIMDHTIGLVYFVTFAVLIGIFMSAFFAFEFPLIEGTENEKGIDIKTLRSLTGLITYDPGFKNTGSCKSSITFLNGEEGILRYRGYSIEDLCDRSSFIEVAFLLIFGELPNKEELNLFNKEIKIDSLVDEDLKMILKNTRTLFLVF